MDSGGAGPSKTEGRILVLLGPSVSFYEDRVIGPTINMTRNADGSWSGWIRNRAMSLSVSPGQISSASLTMNIQDLAQGVEIRGLWISGDASGDQIAMRVTPQELFVREPFVHPPVYLDANGEGRYGPGLYGAAVELKGAAALPHPPQPQFALALLGAF
jgi:hypothetical protein